MKLPYSWLKELVPALPSAHDLEPILANLGLPLEGVEAVPAPPEGVLLATVTRAEAIEGTQLTQLTLDVGAHGERTIASGAPNAVGLPAGTMVALVTPGSRLGDVEYGVRTLQGVESWGMCASAKELGIGEASAGLLLFPAGTAPAGTPMRDVWAADEVLDVEVTPNRADVLSALGLARDLAAALELELRDPPAGPEAHGDGEITVTLPRDRVVIENDPERKPRAACDAFVARTVSGLRNGPSPLWMQRRLTLAGLRTIDLIVDTSNYVMLELGQPTALYDRRDVTNDQIHVGLGLGQGERVADLMGAEHLVHREDLLIRNGDAYPILSPGAALAGMDAPEDGRNVIGIAGIMGGHRGRVRADTTNIVVESAHFDPVMLRRTSTRLGLKTDAVYRYERGVDPALPLRAANRIVGLLGEAGGTVHPGATVAGQPDAPRDLTLTGDHARALLGMNVPTAEMAAFLTRLGCAVHANGDTLTVTPPTWRVDMLIPEDLIEEIARLHGYRNLPETLPTVQVHPDNLGADDESRARRTLKGTLAGLGFQEVVTYTFTNDAEAEAARTERPNVRLRNPLTADRTGLRTALYPSLLRTAGANSKAPRQLLFELGHVFPASGEGERLGLLMRGPLAPRNWQPGVAGGFSVFKGLVEAFAGTLGADLQVEQLRGDAVPGALHPGIAGRVRWNGAAAGWIGALHPEVAAAFGLKGDTFLMELTLPLAGRAWAFRDPSRAPVAWRDLAVIAPRDVSYAEVADVLRAEGGPLLRDLAPFDVYEGESIPEGTRSVAVRLNFQGERTLTDADVDPVMEHLMAAVRARRWSIREK
ncbi:phenylalanine--tRNA ligase subunit beta [Deinococcus maricopensis]|uniref:Phenylalanine--tRNA ligase beta subunit n=1 Tax=Deinococcus maricopensis (strain DSM 21211 / LMG 22137 / NRRL B-23946 / LB-34) TaxID=709986 RepID=E8U4Q3_DEIML|nr:phenylalanine--tRNA ligase beta subunit-related protein [Deinococcus maricopensis]ADV68918.1 Phenylalanyl-tRNA synthetase beta chain [Deinococcus maricopensis DSM 21211]